MLLWASRSSPALSRHRREQHNVTINSQTLTIFNDDEVEKNLKIRVKPHTTCSSAGLEQREKKRARKGLQKKRRKRAQSQVDCFEAKRGGKKPVPMDGITLCLTLYFHCCCCCLSCNMRANAPAFDDVATHIPSDDDVSTSASRPNANETEENLNEPLSTWPHIKKIYSYTQQQHGEK